MSPRPLLLVLALAACATVPPPTLYMLKPTDAAPSAAKSVTTPPKLAVALGPITIPDYLDRTDIARRASDSRLAVADNDRWAEPLRSGLLRVLTTDLANRLGSDVWVAAGTDRSGQVDLEIPVAIEAFEPDAGGRVVLVASWEVRSSRDDHHSLRDRTRYLRIQPAAGTEAQVATMSQAVADLAADLAAAVTKLSPNVNPGTSRPPARPPG